MHDIPQRDLFIAVHDLEGPGGGQASDERGVGGRAARARGSVAARHGGLDVNRDLRRHTEAHAHLVKSEEDRRNWLTR